MRLHFCKAKTSPIIPKEFHIALKECEETEWWIEMLGGSNAISESIEKALLQECGAIRRMLVKSITTAKENS
ncbi:MAG: four helix bundle protein [Clostridia bacterium]|nr:four helix bundle protein [Clostridia bacterium]